LLLYRIKKKISREVHACSYVGNRCGKNNHKELQWNKILMIFYELTLREISVCVVKCLPIWRKFSY
jgi:hypothetical protein